MNKITGFCSILIFLFSRYNQNPTAPERIKKKNLVQLMVQNKHILLTNEAEFGDRGYLTGASSFLIKYHDKTYALTAAHLIGIAADIVPEIQPSQLSSVMESWLMYPLIPIEQGRDTVVLKNTSLNYDSVDSDILMLEVENRNHTTLPLEPTFELPVKDEVLFLVGCPYSDEDCNQRMFNIRYES
jgi:hypothetical protein